MAGVSVGTVSKALYGSGFLSEETGKRVMQTVRALSFRPNMLARSPHTGRSGTVGLISNGSFGRFTTPIMEGLEGVLSQSGFGVFMVNATDDTERERAHLGQLLAKQIHGLMTARRTDRRPSVELRDLGLPVIYVFSQGDAPGTLTLLPDDQGGARLATDHLIQRGRHRIAHVTGRQDFEAVRLRATGWREALTAAGLEPGPLMHGRWSEAWAEAGRKMTEMIKGEDAQCTLRLPCTLLVRDST